MSELEKRGVPTISITSHGFEADFVESAKVFGVPGLPQVIIPYTLTSRTEPQAAGDADAAFQEIVRALTSPPPERAMPTKKKLQHAEQEQFSAPDSYKAWQRFNREYMDRGLGDGFPLVAPTPELVEAFLKVAKRSPLDVVGEPFAPGNGIATVEKLAINCAMAGCDPEHFPVLISSVEAVTQTPGFPLRGLTMSHGPHFFIMLLNGPIVKKLDIGAGVCMLGPGKPGRVNTVLGRALRLIVMNVGHCYPEVSDLDSIGTPYKYSFCVAENEEADPWKQPFHVEQGFKKDQSVVTICGAHSMVRFGGYTPHADKLLAAWASKISGGGGGEVGFDVLGIPGRSEGERRGADVLTFLGPDFARSLAEGGYTKQSIREWLVKNTPGVRLKDLLAIPHTAVESFPADVQDRLSKMDPEMVIPSHVKNPEQIHIVVMGGPSSEGEVVHCMGMTVTKEVDL